MSTNSARAVGRARPAPPPPPPPPAPPRFGPRPRFVPPPPRFAPPPQFVPPPSPVEENRPRRIGWHWLLLLPILLPLCTPLYNRATPRLFGLGGRAFGNWVTWFLLGGDAYTAYTFVAVPALVYAVGAGGFFAVPFAVITYPLMYPLVSRLWSVAHRHGFVTPAEFVRARFGSRALGLAVALSGIAATMPYIALQLIGLEAVMKIMGITGNWPLTVAFVVLALYTFRSGLRAPALISIVKDVLIMWTVLAALLAIAMSTGGCGGILRVAEAHYKATPSPVDGLLLSGPGQVSYLTLVLGSSLGLFLYPHLQTGVLAARNRGVVKRNIAALPLYTLVLGLVALLGFAALANGIVPVGGDRNTIIPALFDDLFPDWCAGLAFAAIGIGALVPA